MRSEREFLVDVLERLNQSGVPYLLTGSLASNYWGTPRTTHDLDFVTVSPIDTFLGVWQWCKPRNDELPLKCDEWMG